MVFNSRVAPVFMLIMLPIFSGASLTYFSIHLPVEIYTALFPDYVTAAIWVSVKSESAATDILHDIRIMHYCILALTRKICGILSKKLQKLALFKL